MPLADRVVFLMDKTALKDKEVLWDIRQCGENANMDCSISICADCYNKEAVKNPVKSLHNSTDFERNRV
jgi:hypothetical protein